MNVLRCWASSVSRSMVWTRFVSRLLGPVSDGARARGLAGAGKVAVSGR
jgi:hypothetical protein